MTPATIGDRRMFFQPRCWWLPDAVLVVAGCFCNVTIRLMASVSPRNGHQTCPTKHVSKHSMFKQRRAGYRPPALTRILDDSSRTGGAVLKIIQLKRNCAASIEVDARRQVKRVRRATADRSPEQATERGAGGDRRSTINTAWDSRNTCNTSGAERRRLPPRQEGFRRARHSYLVTYASRNPSCRG